jgi:cation diffusion facilitator family transporter
MTTMNQAQPSITSQRAQQLFAIRLSLAVGVVMLVGKWYAYGITGSAAILSDAAESVVHIVAVAFAAFSLWLSHQPADTSHPYGHDKISFFSAGIEGFLIILAAAFIIYEAAKKLVGGVVLQNLDTGTFIVLGASVVNLALGGYLVWQGRRSRSLILEANGKHVLTDSWTSFGVVAGLGLTMLTGWLSFDPIVAILVALNILWSGGKLVRQSVGGLMDEGDPAFEKAVRGVLDAETERRGLKYHQLRHRQSGNTAWVEYHLLFPPKTLLEDAHRAGTEIELAVAGGVGIPAQVISHLEPVDDHDVVHTGELKH